MADTPALKTLRRLLPDTLVGLGVFALTLMLTLGDASMAAPYASAGFDTAVPGLDGRHGAVLLLAATFAAIVTLDLAFLRHVMRAYAPRRRSDGRSCRKSAQMPCDTEL